ncbi:Histone acetyltransferase type B catalytic subunit [Stylophora pistillata]|uniref:Histone acetyltransferase type B catalytic subunit n=1 Tax=Stylophora pistillata TaxID=50429 RepID=A0A2B4SG12_STYPI|nr:Histone acetyltransferase type B catalytic subunit [Stylophora pistillata]
MEASMADQALTRYKCDSNTAVRFKLVQCENDVFDKGKEFHPTFSHQYFGDNETIFGYSDLEVQLYYHAGSLLTYIGMKHDGQINSKGLEPDPVMNIIADRYPAGFLTNLDEFIAKLPGEGKFRPMGELLHSYKQNNAEYEMYKGEITCSSITSGSQRIDEAAREGSNLLSGGAGMAQWREHSLPTTVAQVLFSDLASHADVTTPRLRGYHEKLQTFLLWFIDASSYIAQMLQTVDKLYIKDPQVLDITVEDPSYDFLRLRDYVDALACINLSAFSQENLLNGFSGEMVKEAQEKLKINKIQCRRVYEILRLRVTDLSNAEDYKSYRLEVKKRLNVPFQKEKADMEKLKLILKPEELSATVNMQTPQERMQHLEQLYQELESHYRKTIERIAAS